MEVFEVEEWTEGGAAGLGIEGAKAAALSWVALDRGAAVGVVARASAAASAGSALAAAAPAATRDDDGRLLGAAAVAAAAAAGSSSEGAPAMGLLLLLPPPWCESAAASGMGGDVERRAADACSCAEDERRREDLGPSDGDGVRGAGGAHRCAKIGRFVLYNIRRLFKNCGRVSRVAKREGGRLTI